MTDTIEILNPNEVKRRGDAALIDTLGVVGFARYMELFDNGGSGDYTEEKQTMPVMNLSIEDVCKLKTDF